MKYHPQSRLTLPVSQIKRLWWGYEGSYVVELEDGQVMVDVRGYYDGLETVLPEKGQAIKVGEHCLHPSHLEFMAGTLTLDLWYRIWP